jgi:hypothetical protein
MTKVTIASLQAEIASLNNLLNQAAVEAQTEKTKRFAAEAQRNEAEKQAKEEQQNAADARAETERYKGMIEMLERLGTIPKQRVMRDHFGNIIGVD